MNGIDSRITIKLKKLYPNKKAENISQMDKSLYLEISKRRKEKKLKLKDYLESLGFVYDNVNINTNYNIRAIQKLYRDYEVNMSELARIIETAKQNLDQKLKIKNFNNISHISDNFTNEELELIINVINLMEHYYENKSKNIRIKIYHVLNNTDKFAILYKENNKIKYCFDLPEVLIKEIEKVKFNKYREQDIEILKLINFQDGAIEIVNDEYEENDELTSIYINNNKLRNKIITRANKLNLNLEDYTNFLGYRILNRRKYTDGYIKELLEQYKLDNNIIKIPIESNDYIRIFRIAKTRGYKGLEEFVTTYGFKYERLIGTIDINEKYKNIIEQRYIVENTNIYINSSDLFIIGLLHFAIKMVWF